uniref:EamA domain-containing protein n=1 Tax=Chromera velia CCMP2878 TaxID=1169474 RepID=A0A0G4HP42_9ALVE|eukprot:Cvel_1212.t1-p1 / transcript=Cvel_1212.t1 / gene=Cvel_1212 / organism=Chromera_velia_CCMP2878 / gene_product=Probable transport protein YPL264C, putative / transcript_product=Probable transport protein YPL264C, putative / location=Cvel_scaffold40:104759-108048(-) / protein_length=647 / sequence_SO=supercontig / SO=protein_coding / is_pseudo=false
MNGRKPFGFDGSERRDSSGSGGGAFVENDAQSVVSQTQRGEPSQSLSLQGTRIGRPQRFAPLPNKQSRGYLRIESREIEGRSEERGARLSDETQREDMNFSDPGISPPPALPHRHSSRGYLTVPLDGERRDCESGSLEGGKKGLGSSSSTVSFDPSARQLAGGQREPPRRVSFLGMSLVAGAALVFASMTMTAKLAEDAVPILVVILIRSVMQVAMACVSLILDAICMCKGDERGVTVGFKDPSERRALSLDVFIGPSDLRLLVFLRCTFGSLSVALIFFAVAFLPLGDASALFFLSPLLTAILAAVWLGQPWGVLDCLAGVVSFGGVILLTKPFGLFGGNGGEEEGGGKGGLLETSNTRPIGSALALIGAFSSAFAMTLVQKLKQVPFMTLVFSFGLQSCLFSSALMVLLSVVPGSSELPPGVAVTWGAREGGPSRWSWFFVFLTGIFGFLGQCLLNAGLQREKAGPGAMMRNLDIVFAFILDSFVYRRRPSLLSVAGALLVVCGSSLVFFNKILREHQRAQTPESRSLRENSEIIPHQHPPPVLPLTSTPSQSPPGHREEADLGIDKSGGNQPEEELRLSDSRQRGSLSLSPVTETFGTEGPEDPTRDPAAFRGRVPFVSSVSASPVTLGDFEVQSRLQSQRTKP